MKKPKAARLALVALAAFSGALAAELSAACGTSVAPSPFLDLASGGFGGQGGAAAGQGGPFDAGRDADLTLGGPCTVDSQCNDGFDCTLDTCDGKLLHCRFSPDDSKCQNTIVCDGQEVCSNKLGCVLGAPKTCSDGKPCTIDTCDEITGSCKSEPRDADGDGDPDNHCGGGDCDDFDPLVSSKQAEVCGNGKDDNCNGKIDEAGCITPTHDDCTDPLVMPTAGSYALSTVAAKLNFGSSCPVQNAAQARDVVATATVPVGPADVQLTARSDFADTTVTLLGQCGQPGSEITCSKGYSHPKGGKVAKLRARSIGTDKQQLLPVYLTTDQPVPLTLKYEILPATQKPLNETCGTAAVLAPGEPALASVVDAKPDLASACGPATGDLVYQFELLENRDVDIYASSVDQDGLPVISLRGAGCSKLADEITCGKAPGPAASAHIFRHALAPGSYYVAVAATAPTEALVTLQTTKPTPAPPDETCAFPPKLTPGKTIDVPLDNHQDDINTGCLSGGIDAAYQLDLAALSDVLVVARFSQGDQTAIELATAPCKLPSDQLVCAPGYVSPARARKHGLAAGNYRVVTESLKGQPTQITAFVRPAVPTTLVPFADSCKDVQKIPSTGGFFQGNTTNAKADFNAGCDQGNQPPGTAPDQILQLDLPAPKRVVLDMQGSGYATILSLRQGPGCPGAELPKGCTVGYYPDRSFLDFTLSAGTYFLQIDGFNGATGPWFLDVFVTDP